MTSMSSSGFTMSTSAGQKVTIDETSTTTYEKGTTLHVGKHHYNGRKSPRSGDDQRNDHHGQPGRRGTGWQRIWNFHRLKGGPLPEGRPDHVKAGGPDSGELEPRVRDDHQRNSGEQGDRSCACCLPWLYRIGYSAPITLKS